MKKVILFVAALAMAMSVISCGRTSEIKDKAEYIVREAAKASANGDYYRLQELENEEEAYCATLTEEEMEIYNEAAFEAGVELMKELY